MPSKTKKNKSKCKQGKHRNRTTKKCRCVKICKKMGGKSMKKLNS